MNFHNILSDNELYDEINFLLQKNKLTSHFPIMKSNAQVKSIIKGVRERTEMPDMEVESIVRRFGRPVLFIQNDTFELPQSEVLRQRLQNGREVIENSIRAVGRVELREHPKHAWVGTAWLVAEDIVVTNRHVAEEFAIKDKEQFVFKRNFKGRSILARIDFAEEFRIPEQDEYQLIEPLYIEDEDGYDIAFFRVKHTVSNVQPIVLSSTSTKNDNVVTIGYPARDSRIPDQSLMSTIYGDVYAVKRLAPGVLMTEETYNGLTYLTHDCTTLGGNSGSVVLNLDGSGAAGLHFSGSYGEANYAVPATIIADRLLKIT